MTIDEIFRSLSKALNRLRENAGRVAIAIGICTRRTSLVFETSLIFIITLVFQVLINNCSHYSAAFLAYTGHSQAACSAVSAHKKAA